MTYNRLYDTNDCVDKLLTDLNVIGKIGPGTKVNTKDKYLKLDDTTWWQGAHRWYRGDSRDTTYEKIHSTIATSLRFINLALKDLKDNPYEIIPIYMNSIPDEFLRLLYDTLKKTKIGIENLKDTYIHDPTLSSRLEMDLISIKNQMNLIKNNILVDLD